MSEGPSETPLPEALVHAAEPRARRRPRVVVTLWLWTVAAAATTVLPLHAVVARAWGGHPEGDGALAAAGALDLADLVLSLEPRAPALLVAAAAPLVVHQLATPFVLYGAAVAVGRERSDGTAPRAADVAAAAVGAARSLAIVCAATWIAQLAILGAAALLVAKWLSSSMGEARAAAGALGTLALAGVLATAAGAFAEVVLVAHARDSAPTARRALARAWAAVRARGRALTGGYALRAGAGLGCTVAAATVGFGWKSALGAALVQQAALLSRSALRLSWLAHVSRLVEAPVTPDERDGSRAPRTDEQAGPSFDRSS